MQRFLAVVVISLSWALFTFNIANAYEKEIKALSSTLAEGIVSSGKKTIAVVDFTDLQGNVTELGRFLAEEFSVALSEAGKGFQVVDRTHLKSLLRDHQLAQTGLIDPKTARKLGEIAGVEALVTGTLTPFGDSVRLAVKVLDTSTARVIGGSRGDIAKTKAIEELLAKGVDSDPIVRSQAPTSGDSIQSSATRSKAGRLPVMKIFGTTATDIYKRARNGLNWQPYVAEHQNAAKDLVSEYNLLIRKIQNVLNEDRFSRVLMEIPLSNPAPPPGASAGKIMSLSKGIETYMTSLEGGAAFKDTASSLAEIAKGGINWQPYTAEHQTAAKDLAETYNIVIKEIKSYFEKSRFVSSLEPVESKDVPPSTIAARILALAKELELLLASAENR